MVERAREAQQALQELLNGTNPIHSSELYPHDLSIPIYLPQTLHIMRRVLPYLFNIINIVYYTLQQ